METPGIDQSDAEYDNVKTWNWAPYETLYRTDGTRMGLVRDADGTRHIGEIPTQRSGSGCRTARFFLTSRLTPASTIWTSQRARSTASGAAPATAIPSAPGTEASG